MKVSCPNCQRVLQAPDEWGGRTVKCPGCKKPINLPKSDAHDDLGYDLNSLDALEHQGEALVRDAKVKPLSHKEAMAAKSKAAEEAGEPVADPRIRVCPKCGLKVRSDDQFSEIICRHCNAGIPPRVQGKTQEARYTGSLSGRMTTKVSFYTGFTGAALYPIPGLASILMGMGIALGVIALPLFGVLAFTQASTLNEASIDTRHGATAMDSASWVGIFLTVMFALEAIYFGAVAYYAMIDTVRSTASGSEVPPNLTWNVVNLGAALGGYVALIVFYFLVVVALIGGLPTSGEALEKLSHPGRLLLIAILTFSVPMNMIGLASSHAMDGLNPVKVFRSIGKVFGHYTFLFLISLLYLCIYTGLMWGIMGWAGPMITSAASKGLKGGVFPMLAGIAAWGLMIGLGFYLAYSIGRILGLFTRSYRENMEFEL